MKKLLLSLAAVAALGFAANAAEVTVDFSSASITNLPTASNGTFGTPVEWTSNNVNFAFNYCYKGTSANYIMVYGKGTSNNYTDAYIQFSTATTVKSIVLNTTTASSGSAKLQLYAGETAVGDPVAPNNSAFTFEVPEQYQAANTTYKLAITTNYNVQATSLVLSDNGATPEPDPEEPDQPDQPTEPTGNVADFNTMNDGAAKSSYGTYTSKDGWVATNSALLAGQDAGANDNSPYFAFIGTKTTFAPTLNAKAGSEGTLTSPTLKNGLGTLSFNYGFAFADKNVKFTINIKQGATTVKTQTYTFTNLTQKTAYKLDYDADVAGDFVIEIVNDGYGDSRTGNTERLSIWNLTWTNCETAKADPGLEFSAESVTVTGLDGTFTAPTLTKATDGALTYTSSNEKVATVTNEGVVTIVNYGSAVIEVSSAATDTYSAGQAAYTIVVTPGRINVAKAIELINSDLTFDAEVIGYVSWVKSINTTYGSLTYYIVDEYDAEASTAQSTENALQVYGGLWKEGAQFSATTDLTPGQPIIVSGSLKAYNGEPEIDLNSVVIAYGSDVLGVEKVEIDANAAVEYFNLQGVRVANPENGLYIRRQGNNVTKVLVK